MSVDVAAAGARIITTNDWGPVLPIVRGDGSCREIIGQGAGATLRSLYHLALGQLATTVPMRHGGEAVYYVVSGQAEAAAGSGRAISVPEGGMVHLAAGTTYTLSSVAGATLVGGPCPVDPDFGRPVEVDGPSVPGGLRIFSRDRPGLMVPLISQDARLVVWYGVGAVDANMNYVVLEPGERNREHLHAYSEDTIYILEGRGTAEDVTHGRKLPFGPGDTVTIPPGVVHAIAADRGERVVSAGGPCPADLDMLRASGVDVDALTASLG